MSELIIFVGKNEEENHSYPVEDSHRPQTHKKKKYIDDK